MDTVTCRVTKNHAFSHGDGLIKEAGLGSQEKVLPPATVCAALTAVHSEKEKKQTKTSFREHAAGDRDLQPEIRQLELYFFCHDQSVSPGGTTRYCCTYQAASERAHCSL